MEEGRMATPKPMFGQSYGGSVIERFTGFG